MKLKTKCKNKKRWLAFIRKCFKKNQMKMKGYELIVSFLARNELIYLPDSLIGVILDFSKILTHFDTYQKDAWKVSRNNKRFELNLDYLSVIKTRRSIKGTSPSSQKFLLFSNFSCA